MSASAAAATSVRSAASKSVSRSSSESMQSFIAALQSQAQTKPHRLLPGTQRVRFSVRNTTDYKPSSYFPGQPRGYNNRFQLGIGEPSQLSLLAFHNPQTVFEVQYRRSELNKVAQAAIESSTLAAVEESHRHWTREFLDVWKGDAIEPERVDITDLTPDEILEVVCEPVEGGQASPKALSTGQAVPLEEGEELDAYSARQNELRLQALRASGKLADLLQKRLKHKAELERIRIEREEQAAKAEALAQDAPAEGLEFFSFDDDVPPPAAAAFAASTTEGANPDAAGPSAASFKAGVDADDFEHSSAAWEAIEQRMKARADADTESKAPPS